MNKDLHSLRFTSKPSPAELADARQRLDNLRRLLPDDDFFFIVFSMPDDQQPAPKPPEMANGVKRVNGLPKCKLSDPEDNTENEFLPSDLIAKHQKKSPSKKREKLRKSPEPEYDSRNCMNGFDVFSKLQLLNSKAPSPEKVIIEEQQHMTDTTSLSKLLKPSWSPVSSTSAKKEFDVHNHSRSALILSSGVKPAKLKPAYTMATSTNTCNTVTTVSGGIPSVLGAASQCPPRMTEEVVLPDINLANTNNLNQDPVPTSLPKVGRLLRPGPQTPHYAEALRLCDHDVLRMLGKQLLFEEGYTRGRFFKSMLESIIEGSVSKFTELFEHVYHQARAEKRNKMFTNAQLKRQAMLQLLGFFISKSTDANLFMILAAARKPHDDKDTVIPCHLLLEPHGYCGLIRFIGSVLRPTEVKTLLAVKNTYSGRSALNIAAVAGSMCQMQALLKLGASTDTVDDVGNNPIHYVVRRVHLENFLLLSHYGADLYACGIGPDGNVDTFAEYVVRACTHARLRNFILNRLAALQTIFLEKCRKVIKDAKRDVTEVLSGLHFARVLTPKLNTNKIEVDFEFESNSKSFPDLTRHDIVIMVTPFSYKDSDLYAPAMAPEIEFEKLEPGEQGLIDGSLKFFDLNVFKTIFSFDGCVVSQIGRYMDGAFAFKLTPKQGLLPVRREGPVRGRLIFNTSGDPVRFDRTLFAIQAFSVFRGENFGTSKDIDGQWPVRHRLRDTLLIGNEYVKLDPKTLPSSLKKAPKTKYSEATSDKKAGKKKSKKGPVFEASPMAVYVPKSERKAKKKPAPPPVPVTQSQE